MSGSLRPAAPELRPMALGDYGEVLELWRSTPGIGLSDSDAAPAIAEFLARNPDLSQVVVLPGGKIGGAVLCGHDGRRGYLHHLAVAAGHRKRGLARTLVTACLQGLAKHGIPKCNVFLFDHNAEGRAFWLHNGWSERDDLCVLQHPTSTP